MPRENYTYEALTDEEQGEIARRALGRVESQLFALEIELDQMAADNPDREEAERRFNRMANQAQRMKQTMADRGIPRQRQQNPAGPQAQPVDDPTE